MERYIGADKLKQRKRHIEFIMSNGKLYDGYDFVKFSDIDETPTADVQEVKHAHWCRPNWQTEEYYFCSNCDIINDSNTRYCPHCGAIMDGKENDE